MDSSKLRELERDLTSTAIVSFTAMLKGICVRMARATRPVQQKEDLDRAEENMRILRESAVELCNSSSEHAHHLKESLRNGCVYSCNLSSGLADMNTDLLDPIQKNELNSLPVA
jgi:hypothetical protein